MNAAYKKLVFTKIFDTENENPISIKIDVEYRDDDFT